MPLMSTCRVSGSRCPVVDDEAHAHDHEGDSQSGEAGSLEKDTHNISSLSHEGTEISNQIIQSHCNLMISFKAAAEEIEFQAASLDFI